MKHWIRNFSQKKYVNFSYLHDISELWDGEAKISPGNTLTCGVLVLAKSKVSPMEQTIIDPAARYVFFKIKNTVDAVLALYATSGIIKKLRIDRQMLISKIKKLLYKKIIRKDNLILMGYFNMTLGNKGRSTGNRGFCESQEELMSLITEFDLEDPWRRQNPNGHLYMHFGGRNNTYSRIDRSYTSTNSRVGVKISDQFLTI